MKKTFVIDTSVFAFDPKCLEKLENCDIIIPIEVLEELDKLKSYQAEIGKNARTAIRKLDEISNLGEIHKGIKLKNKTIKILSDYEKSGSDDSYNDNKILGCALSIKKKDVCLLSRDINLRVRAKSLGLQAEDYSSKIANYDEFYSGFKEIADESIIQEIMESKSNNDLLKFKIKAFPHQFILFKDTQGNDISQGRFFDDKVKMLKKHKAWGITPRNIEQNCALDLMFDPNVPLVSLIGQAGCGKTLLALAAALELVLHNHSYNKLIIYRPIQPIGKDIGYVPGTKFEKLSVWMSAIFDNFETLLGNDSPNTGKNSRNKKKLWMEDLEMFIEKGLIELDCLTYVRGRSINNALIIIDEAQNLSANDAKTLLTRIGTGTKVIFTGDIAQIDDKSLDSHNNAIGLITETFKESKLAGHVTFVKSERSELATEALRLL